MYESLYIYVCVGFVALKNGSERAHTYTHMHRQHTKKNPREKQKKERCSFNACSLLCSRVRVMMVIFFFQVEWE